MIVISMVRLIWIFMFFFGIIVGGLFLFRRGRGSGMDG